jgi:hypothetical protein
MIHIGDRVKIADVGKIYSTYPDFLDDYWDISVNTLSERVRRQYTYGYAPTEAEIRNTVFTVMFVGEHGEYAGINLAVINDGSDTYIINANALTLVSSDLPFTEGDRVFIKDPSHVYSEWQKLIKHMSAVIPDGTEVYRKWFDCRMPDAEEEDGKSPEAVFYVKWIGHHVSRPDEAIVAIISNNTHTYIIGAKGLEKAEAGEKSWDKYIIYVRNWAVVNKNNPQSAKDAAGPKSYAEWRTNKS